MTQNHLELTGSFRSNTFAELVIEISQATLTGSLRCSAGDKKSVFYFDGGSPVFCVSNSRNFRLSEILVSENNIDRGSLKKYSGISNDLELAVCLERDDLLTKAASKELIERQIGFIFADLLLWEEGDWSFDPLARVRGDISYPVRFYKILLEHARQLPAKQISQRFRSGDETFTKRQSDEDVLDLQPHEAFVLSRFDNEQLRLAEIIQLCGLPEQAGLKTIYSLWMAGMLRRGNWNPAFSDVKIATLLSSKLKPKKQTAPARAVQAKRSLRPVSTPDLPPAQEISLEEYLDRANNAISHYEFLGIDQNAPLELIRRNYFSLAKAFHPDRFHREEPEKLRQIAHAFTALSQAHEILKNSESRSAYDKKLTKELADIEKLREMQKAGKPVERNVNADRAAEDFERGFSLLMDNKWESATPFLARSVHFEPNNARYHAFFGKALSGDETQRHKAEGELQTAIKLEPDNPSYRIMLVEFFVRNKLVKRAEGELKRLLAAFPDNKEALALLDSLQAK
jgi:curved DNA-binding protein CbpA